MQARHAGQQGDKVAAMARTVRRNGRRRFSETSPRQLGITAGTALHYRKEGLARSVDVCDWVQVKT